MEFLDILPHLGARDIAVSGLDGPVVLGRPAGARFPRRRTNGELLARRLCVRGHFGRCCFGPGVLHGRRPGPDGLPTGRRQRQRQSQSAGRQGRHHSWVLHGDSPEAPNTKSFPTARKALGHSFRGDCPALLGLRLHPLATRIDSRSAVSCHRIRPGNGSAARKSDAQHPLRSLSTL